MQSASPLIKCWCSDWEENIYFILKFGLYRKANASQSAPVRSKSYFLSEASDVVEDKNANRLRAWSAVGHRKT